MATALDRLAAQIRACRICVDHPVGAPLAHAPRPVLRVSRTARIAVVGQAPGTRVHASGIPFSDASGERLRAWMGVTADEFYDVRRVAIVPMGFCYPGQDAHGGDLPPRRECAPRWRPRLFEQLPRIELMLLVGGYAQRWHLKERARGRRHRDGRGLARDSGRHRSPALPAAAASVLAQQRLAQGTSVVRGKARSAPAGRGSGPPRLRK